MRVKHRKASAKVDSADPSLVNATDWNDTHAIDWPVPAIASASGVLDVDLNAGSLFTVALTESISAMSFSNLPGSGKGVTIALRLTQDATARTVAWPSSFRWSGTAPAIPATPGAVSVLWLTTFDNGAKWEASLSTDRASTGGGGGGSAPVSPDSYPASPNAADDEFDGASLDTAGTRRSGATAWTWVNQGAATASLAQGAVKLNGPAGSTDNLRLITQPVSGSAWKYRAKFSTISGGATPIPFWGIAARNSVSGKILSFHRLFNGGFKIEGNRWNSPSSYSSTPYTTADAPAGAQQPFYMEMELSSGFIALRWSHSGHDGSFIQFGAEDASFFLGGADQIGLFVATTNGQDAFAMIDWFRKVA